jgi:hypothetical protein
MRVKKSTTNKRVNPVDVLPELLEVLRRVPKNRREKLIEASLLLLDAEEDTQTVPIRPPRPSGGIRYGIPF